VKGSQKASQKDLRKAPQKGLQKAPQKGSQKASHLSRFLAQPQRTQRGCWLPPRRAQQGHRVCWRSNLLPAQPRGSLTQMDQPDQPPPWTVYREQQRALAPRVSAPPSQAWMQPGRAWPPQAWAWSSWVWAWPKLQSVSRCVQWTRTAATEARSTQRVRVHSLLGADTGQQHETTGQAIEGFLRSLLVLGKRAKSTALQPQGQAARISGN